MRDIVFCQGKLVAKNDPDIRVKPTERNKNRENGYRDADDGKNPRLEPIWSANEPIICPNETLDADFNALTLN